MTKRFFDDEAAIIGAVHRALHQSRRTHARDDIAIIAWRRCQIKDTVALGAAFLIQFVQLFGQLIISGVIVEFHLAIADALRECFPQCFIIGLAGVVFHTFLDVATKTLIRPIAACDTDDGQIRRQRGLVSSEAIEGRKQLALSQIARRAKDDHDARIDGARFRKPLAQGIVHCQIVHYHVALQQMGP